MQEVIEKIKTAEAAVQSLKLEAEKQAGEMISKAKLDGKKLIETTVADANQEAEGAVRQAEEKAAAEAKEKVAAAKREADEILDIAQSRMDQAATAIAEGIVDQI